MMGDEFLESDVFWPEIHRRDGRRTAVEGGEIAIPPQPSSRLWKNKSSPAISPPVSIPGNLAGAGRTSWFHFSDFYEGEDDEMVPPHLIVSRRIAGKMAFSVCTGNGRTLKGRDLSQVRNSILRMTGFLET